MPEEVKNIDPVETLPDGEEGDIKLFGGELGEEDKITESDEKEEVKEPLKEEGKEEKEEKKEEEPKEELEEVTTKPSWSKVTEKYPNFFKEFPEIRNALGRDREYSEMFPDGIEQAKSVIENDKDFRFFEKTVEEGNAKEFLSVIKEADKADLTKFADNFLPALREIDGKLHMEVTAPLVLEVLQQAYQDGARAGNENLLNSAEHLAKYIFGNHEFASGKAKLSMREQKTDVKSSEKDEISKERREFLIERYNIAITDVDNGCRDRLSDVIREQLPEDLSEFTAKHVISDIIDEVDIVVSKNPEHTRMIKKLWQEAEKNRFDSSSSRRLINAYIQSAKEVLPDIRRKLVSSATRGKVEHEERRREVTGGSKGGSKPTRSSKEVDWRNTSDEDLFSGNVKYKS